jgi:PAS domain-containing protein
VDRELRVLIVEDSAADAEFITKELGKGGLVHTSKMVKSKDEFLKALGEYIPDIILCDYAMPGFGAPEALEIVKEMSLKTPFVIVSGAIGEDVAVEMLKSGAVDYVMKGNISRLAPVVTRALKENKERAERKQAEEKLNKSIQLLRDTGEMAKVGGWELDLATKEVLLTEEVCRIHGVEPGYKPTLEEAFNFYAPESRPDVEAVVKKAAETGEPYDLESLFIPLGSKDKIWVRSLGRAVYSGGKIVKLIGTFQNIDKYKKAEEALKAERQRLHDVLEAIPVMVCLLTPDYHVDFSNRAFREKFGESRGRCCYEYCFGKKEPCDFCQTYQVLKTTKPHHWQVTTPDGASVIDVHDFPFTDVDGSPMILEFDIDITERKKMEEEAQKRLQELEVFYKASVGREERILELKKQVAELEEKLKGA